MKRAILVGLLGFMVFYSCKQDDSDPDLNPEIMNYFPMSIGNYWVYDHYRYDMEGSEQLVFENDTVKIIGDTIIGGENYFIFYGRPLIYSSSLKQYYLRRLGQNIVDPDNKIMMSFETFNEKLVQEVQFQGTDTLYETYMLMEEITSPVIVSIGTFEKTLNRKTVMIGKILQMPINPRIMNSYYANGVGKLTNEYAYSSQEGYYNKKLKAYHLE